MTVVSLRLKWVLTVLCQWWDKFSATALLFALCTERCEGRVHSHHFRGGLQPGEACGDRTPGARPARAQSSATMEEGKQDRSEEWGKTHCDCVMWSKLPEKKDLDMVINMCREGWFALTSHILHHLHIVIESDTVIMWRISSWIEEISKPLWETFNHFQCIL